MSTVLEITTIALGRIRLLQIHCTIFNWRALLIAADMVTKRLTQNCTFSIIKYDNNQTRLKIEEIYFKEGMCMENFLI